MSNLKRPTHHYEKINTSYCLISKKLEAEIEYALKNLLLTEQQKTQGKKKKRWTKLEASHELGKWLHSQRNSNNKVSFIFEFQ